ncbi:UNVERIFIED_ORG: preprotein translocase subunit SecG [Comamonas terrigena]
MAIIVFFLAVIYFALFFVVAVYASRNNKSATLWIFISLTLTPFISLIILRGNIIQERQKANQH